MKSVSIFFNIGQLSTKLNCDALLQANTSFLCLINGNSDLIAKKLEFFNLKKNNLLNFIFLNNAVLFSNNTAEDTAFNNLIFIKTNRALIESHLTNFLPLFSLIGLNENNNILMGIKNVFLKTHPITQHLLLFQVTRGFTDLNYKINDMSLNEKLPAALTNILKFSDTKTHFNFYKKSANDVFLFN